MSEQHAVGESARRYAQLQEQTRYELAVTAAGIDALLEPYALNDTEPEVPRQRRPVAEAADL